MQQSRARWLETAVLSVASSSGTLNLTRIPGKTLPDPAPWLDLARPDDRVVIVQAQPSSFPAEMAARIGPGGSVTAILAATAVDVEATAPTKPNCNIVRSGLGDLSTNPAKLEELLTQLAPRDRESYLRFDECLRRQRRSEPWFAADSVDLVVYNLVDLAPLDRTQIAAAFDEAFRVLRRHGRIVIAALLADQPAREADES